MDRNWKGGQGIYSSQCNELAWEETSPDHLGLSDLEGYVDSEGEADWEAYSSSWQGDRS